MNLSIIFIAAQLVVLIINITLFIAIKFNDLKHLDASNKELKNEIKSQSEKIEALSQRVARIEGKMCIPEE